MSRHTSPNKKRIDDVFPIRIKFKIPAMGLGNLIGEMQVWLCDNIGVDRFANQSTTGVYCQATAYYFRSLSDAQSFLDAFPTLALADGLEYESSLSKGGGVRQTMQSIGSGTDLGC